MNASIYSRRLPTDGSIRVLRLDAANDKAATVVCNLEEIVLSRNPKYEALSYTWGTLGTGPSIILNGQPFRVHENLGAALRRLRHPTKNRSIWIDALCINQEDVTEREEQVQLMRQIYEQAELVTVWLGELTEDGIVGIKLLDSWVGSYWEHYKSEKKKHGYSWQHWNRLISGGSYGLEDRTRYCDEHAVGELRELLDRPWWRRVWIVQEVVLAKRLILQCGPACMEWNDILKRIARDPSSSFLQLDSLVRSYEPKKQAWPSDSCLTLSRLRKERLAKEWDKSIYDLLYSFRDFKVTDPRDRIHAFLGLATDIEGIPFTPDYKSSIEEVYTTFTRSLITLHGHLCILNCKREPVSVKAADDRSLAFTLTDQARYHDTEKLIYNDLENKARIGWARLPKGWERCQDAGGIYFYDHINKIRAEVSPIKNTPPAKTQPFEFQRQIPDSWEKGWDNLGRARVHYIAGGSPAKAVSELTMPSWVPNWNTNTSGDPFPLLDWSTQNQRFWASGKHSRVTLQQPSVAGSLALKGFVWDEIDRLGPVWHPQNEWPPLSRTGHPEFSEWETLAVSEVPNCPYGDVKARHEAFWRALVCDHAGDAAMNDQDRCYFDAWFAGDEWNGSAPDYSYNGYFERFTKGFKAELLEVKLHRHLVKKQGWNRWSQTLPHIILQKYKACMERIYRSTAHKRLFVTKKGYIGLAAWNTKKEDKVCVLLGGYTPFLLRQLPDTTRYSLTGEAFIYGIMAGETMTEQGLAEMQLIEIS